MKLEDLTPEQLRKAINNMSDENLMRLDLGRDVNSSFIFATSKEGTTYWTELHTEFDMHLAIEERVSALRSKVELENNRILNERQVSLLRIGLKEGLSI